MAREHEEDRERHGALTKGRSDMEKESESLSIHLWIELEADIIDTGLFVKLAHQLHQVLSIKS